MAQSKAFGHAAAVTKPGLERVPGGCLVCRHGAEAPGDAARAEPAPRQCQNPDRSKASGLQALRQSRYLPLAIPWIGSANAKPSLRSGGCLKRGFSEVLRHHNSPVQLGASGSFSTGGTGFNICGLAVFCVSRLLTLALNDSKKIRTKQERTNACSHDFHGVTP